MQYTVQGCRVRRLCITFTLNFFSDCLVGCFPSTIFVLVLIKLFAVYSSTCEL
jgi:hypothetical protein